MFLRTQLFVTSLLITSAAAQIHTPAVPETTVSPATGLTKGDCDGDCRLTTLDARCALEMSVQLVTVIQTLDMDGTNGVDSRDAFLILNDAVSGSEQGEDGDVVVPDLAGLASVGDIKATLDPAGLPMALTAAGKERLSKESGSIVESQKPPAGTRVAKGCTVTVAIYQQYQEPEVVVPDLKAVGGVAEVKAALEKAGLKGTFGAAKVATPSKDLEFKAESQNPAAGSKVKQGSTVTVAIYQQYQEPNVIVPDLKALGGVAEMKSVLDKAGLKGAFTFHIERLPSLVSA